MFKRQLRRGVVHVQVARLGKLGALCGDAPIEIGGSC